MVSLAHRYRVEVQVPIDYDSDIVSTQLGDDALPIDQRNVPVRSRVSLIQARERPHDAKRAAWTRRSPISCAPLH